MQSIQVAGFSYYPSIVITKLPAPSYQIHHNRLVVRGEAACSEWGEKLSLAPHLLPG